MFVGKNVTITIVRIEANTVRIGIEAPAHINIVRAELLEADELADRERTRQQIDDSRGSD